MSTALLARLFALSCELHPDLPSIQLTNLLGSTWGPLIRAGAEHGLAGASAALPLVSVDQLAQLYMAGVETGAEMSLEEFRSALAGQLYRGICSNDNMPVLQQIKLSGELAKWVDGRGSANGEDEIDWDAEVVTPPFTKTGFWPIDDLHGPNGCAQEICTVLARPGVGKTTSALAIGKEWRKQDIGSVYMIQTEIAPSALRMKINSMCEPGLFRSGVDRLIFGRRNAETAMQRLINEPDPDRLVLFDSATGFAGGGDDSASRTRFVELYEMLCQVKNSSRMVFCFSHVKRGTDMADIESAAGSSAIERWSGSMIYMTSDNVSRPDGLVEIRAEILKNRYGSLMRPRKFLFDYSTGAAYQHDPLEAAMEELS